MDDLISRQAAIDAISKGYGCGNVCRRALEQLPSAEKTAICPSVGIDCEDCPAYPSAEPTGHWIYIKNSDVNGLKIVKCDNCHKRAYGSTDYCPNCGARMIKEGE